MTAEYWVGGINQSAVVVPAAAAAAAAVVVVVDVDDLRIPLSDLPGSNHSCDET